MTSLPYCEGAKRGRGVGRGLLLRCLSPLCRRFDPRRERGSDHSFQVALLTAVVLGLL